MPGAQSLVQGKITISGKEITKEILSIELEQSVTDHHLATVKIHHPDLRDVKTDEYIDFVGQDITITFTPEGGVHESQAKVTDFIGVTTGLHFEQSADGQLVVVLKANSPTIRLDQRPRVRSFQDMSATDIAKKVLSEYSITHGDVDIDSSKAPLVVQHCETDLQFIKRMATYSGKFVYYDGTKLHIGKAESKDTHSFPDPTAVGGAASLQIGTGHYMARGFSWDAEKRETRLSKPGSLTKSPSDFSAVSVKASDDLFTKDHADLGWFRSGSQKGLDTTVTSLRDARVNNLVTLSLQSDVVGLRVGNCLTFNAGFPGKSSYWIRGLKQMLSGTSGYRNEIDCIPLDLAYPQPISSARSMPGLMTATVVNIEDPESLGRVKVKFPWNDDTAGPMAPEDWYRVATISAAEDTGFLWMPDVGDEVIVGFVGGSVQEPVVLGSLYSKAAAPPSEYSGGNLADNYYKVIRTTGENQIIFDDTSGAETITISQQGGKNALVLTLGGPSITLESQGDVTISGKTITLKSTSGDIKLDAAGALEMSSGGDTKIDAGANLKAGAMANAEVKATGNADFKGSGIVTVQGSLVKIN